MSPIRKHAGPALAVASLLSIVLATSAHGQQQPAPPGQQQSNAVSPAPEDDARAAMRSETRIRKLHDRLRVSADEEALWSPVAQVMRDNEKEFRADLREKTAGMTTATAVNDLKTFQVIADHHSSGLKRFVPVFEKLYSSMPPAQQKRADGIFIDIERSLRV